MNKLVGYENNVKNKDIISIQMNLLNKCTSRCKSCRKYTWPNDKIDIKDVEKILTVLKRKFNLQSVCFSGGDPILYDDFEKVVEIVEKLNIKYSLITTMITNDIERVKLIARTAYRIHISIDAVDNGLYKKIRGVDGLDIVKRNIAIINENRDKKCIPIRISSTIGIFNYDHVYSLYLFAKENNCLINYYLLHTWDNLKMNENELGVFNDLIYKIVKDEKKNNKAISNASAYLFENIALKQSYNIKRCYLPYVHVVINSNGDIYPCCRLLDDNGEYGKQIVNSYGNVVNKTDEEIEVEFNKRFNRSWPIVGTLCDECASRYEGVLKELETIMTNEREVLFF